MIAPCEYKASASCDRGRPSEYSALMGAHSAPGLHHEYDRYLVTERDHGCKLDYWNGLMLAMAGGTPGHSARSARLALILGAQLQGALHRLHFGRRDPHPKRRTRCRRVPGRVGGRRPCSASLMTIRTASPTRA